MRVVLVLITVAFAQPLFAGESISFPYTFEKFHSDFKYDAMKVCQKQISGCTDLETPESMNLDDARLKYDKLKDVGNFDFVFKADCKDKVKKTITYLCHIKVKLQQDANGANFNGNLNVYEVK